MAVSASNEPFQAYGVLYYRARYYQPSTGRFISEDPADSFSSLYAYANNDPVANVDPSGLLVEVRCERIGSHGLDRRTLAAFYRHCFVRTQCCKGEDKFDKTVEVGGTTEGGTPPLFINNFDGKRGSVDIFTNPSWSPDCHLEKCVLNEAEKIRGGIKYNARKQNSNTFVHRLISACGIQGFTDNPPVGW